MGFRVGLGYDVHALVSDRALILGGVHIPYDKGLLGHSDADVLVHAIMDSLLGAVAKGDIGAHFPDTDDTYKGISSMTLLQKVYALVQEEGYHIVNLDCIIVAQKPKLLSYIGSMKTNIAACLSIQENCINIKATTEEGLGFTGRGEGIASKTVCLIEHA